MRRVISLVAAVACVIAGGYLLDGGGDRARALPTEIRTTYGPADFPAAMAEADRHVAAKRTRLASASDDWLRQEQLALALHQRFALTGEIADLREAQTLTADGLRIAPDPAGPSLTQAQLAMTLHALDEATSALDRFDRTVARQAGDVAFAHALRGDIAFQRGELARAVTEYEGVHAMRPDIGSAARRANVALWSGKPEQAARLLDTELQRTRQQPQHFAGMALLRANFAIATGDMETAGEWVAVADRAFPGFWLTETMAAQQLAAEGDWEGGIAALEALARRHPKPEAMDLLAGFLIHRGEEGRAAIWTKRAERLWGERLADAPAAYRLHAAEHYLDFGDVRRALALSSVEYAARPFGEAAEVHASALLANARPQEALAVLERADRAGFRSVSLHLARAEALEALGESRKARIARRAARALNPEAEKPLRKLLRFGHY